MIDRLLVANRGEIACRIARTCRRLGVAVVAVFTDVDQDSLWVAQADEAFRVPSYLDVEALLEVARRADVQAVHPGFGFLAENVGFARAVQAAGLIWVGPGPACMELLSSKEDAKQLARQADVPVLPGLTPETATFPLMVKALAGGGGKGMRRVDRAEELEQALQSVRSEAGRSFGDDRVLLEPLLEGARHLEVQILGDNFGQLVHLGERDCSLQRRHQKILEETPAADLSDDFRQRLHQAAVRLARAAHYQNAGTVEFLVSGDSFYFLEMNTRLQVEHPVTEEVTGLDLVEWQLRLAQGEHLPWSEPPGRRGHAVEVRLYAEDPAQQHSPCAGPVLLWEPPPEIRLESALRSGQEISPHYDPMVAKLVAWGEDRPTALRRLRRAVERTVLFGVASNRDLLAHWLDQAPLGPFCVDTLAAHPWQARLDEWAPWAAAASSWLNQAGQLWRNLAGELPRWDFEGHEPFHWDNSPCGLLDRCGGSQGEAPVVPFRGHEAENPFGAHSPPWNQGWIWLEREGQRRHFRVLWHDQEVWVASQRAIQRLTLRSRVPQARVLSDGSILAPLTGSIVEVLVQAGDIVAEGQTLVRLEAMKMEHRLISPLAGVVVAVHCQCGEVVQARSLLIKLT